MEIAEKRNKARNGSGVAWSRGYVQRSTRAAIRGILVLLVLAHARVRALIPTTLVHSFKHTRRSLSCAFARSRVVVVGGWPSAAWWGEVVAGWGWAARAERGRVGSGQKGRDSFSTRQPERRMRLRQSSRSLVIYHSPSRSPPLPPCPCPIAFSARLSVSNIEFPLYNSLCPIYRPAYVRNVFLVHPSDASVIIAYDFRDTGDENRESEITGCWLKKTSLSFSLHSLSVYRGVFCKL